MKQIEREIIVKLCCKKIEESNDIVFFFTHKFNSKFIHAHGAMKWTSCLHSWQKNQTRWPRSLQRSGQGSCGKELDASCRS
jgi:hypothetical protein